MKPEDPFDSLSQAKWIDRQCDAFEKAWSQGREPRLEDFVQEVDESVASKALLELLPIDILFRRKGGQSISTEDYAARFPFFPVAQIQLLIESTVANDAATSISYDGTTADLKVDEGPRSPTAPRKVSYFGDYELLEKVARGGMGTVYRARQLSLNRQVAIKMINSGQFASTEEIRRFYSEAEAAASLDHPNIVPVYEVGEHEGDHFYSMAFVDGKSLAELLSLGPMEPRKGVELLRTVAMAVHYAHEQGVIHRDIKPSNILLEAQGRPRVADFGLAKRMLDGTALTMSGDILGTPSFMPPEQATGLVHSIGFSSDVYSLGAVLYMCLSGRPPFQAATHVATLHQVIEDEPVPLRQLNSVIERDLETVVHKCLDKSISRRYPTAKDLAEDLDRVLEGIPVRARRANQIEKCWRWCRRRPSQALNAIAVIALIVGSVLGLSWIRYREKIIAAELYAQSLLDDLNSAEGSELPPIVSEVRSNPVALPLIQQQFDQEPSESLLRYRAAVVMLPIHPSVALEVCNGWVNASWAEWNWLAEQMNSHRSYVREWLQKQEQRPDLDWEDSSFVKFCAIRASMSIKPNHGDLVGESFSKAELERIASIIIQEARRDPTSIKNIARALRSLSHSLGPYLADQMDHTRLDGRQDAGVAASLLVELFSENIDSLFQYGWNAKSEVLPILFGNPLNSASLKDSMRQRFLQNPESKSWEELTRLARQRALAAAVLYHLGDTDPFWSLLVHHEDPSVRSLLIEWIPLFDRTPRKLILKTKELLANRPRAIERIVHSPLGSHRESNPWLFEKEGSQLRGALQLLGNYPASQLRRMTDESFWSNVLERYEFDPDPGVHASCEWLLRQAGYEEKRKEVFHRLTEERAERKGWYVNSQGHVMAKIRGPIEFVAGAALQDPYRIAGSEINPVSGEENSWSDDHPHPKRIDRSFAIALHETRFGQVQKGLPDFYLIHNVAIAPTLDHPANKVSWFNAAEYCNWLSKIEGLDEDQFCFVESGSGTWQYAPDYLHRTGYRLPTSAEWEYACRAGTQSRWYLGNTDELLWKNVWFLRNSEEARLVPTGSLKPNELGLFESLGNVREWCMDAFESNSKRLERDDVETFADAKASRILRGASIFSMAKDVRAADFGNFNPGYKEPNIGFRIARTIPSP